MKRLWIAGVTLALLHYLSQRLAANAIAPSLLDGSRGFLFFQPSAPHAGLLHPGLAVLAPDGGILNDAVMQRFVVTSST